MGEKIDDDVLDDLLKGCERPEDLLGAGGLMKELKKALMQRMLGAELTEYILATSTGWKHHRSNRTAATEPAERR